MSTRRAASARLTFGDGQVKVLSAIEVIDFPGEVDVECQLTDPRVPLVDVGLIYSEQLAARGELRTITAGESETISVEAGASDGIIVVLAGAAVLCTASLDDDNSATPARTFHMGELDCLHAAGLHGREWTVVVQEGVEATLLVLQVRRPKQ